MKKKLVIAVVCLLILSYLLFRYVHEPSRSYQGYVEGDLLYLASPHSGQLVEMKVQRGQEVKKGELLFVLNPYPQSFNIEAAKAKVSSAEHTLQDLINPKRVEEIEALQAQIAEVEAQLKLARIRVSRYENLYKKQATDRDQLDESISLEQQLLQKKAALEDNLDLALKGSREEQIKAQEASVSEAKSALAEAEWQLRQKTIFAPAAGVVFDTYYEPFEFVSAEKPLASVLSPDNIHIDFFVPIAQAQTLHLGQKINFVPLGLEQNHEAILSYISPTAEYMPPLVYSRDNEDKLVFRIKAKPKDPRAFKPGLPVVITSLDP